MNFDRLNYSTIYKSNGDLGKINLSSFACFRNIFYKIEDNELHNKKVNQSYSIYIATTSELIDRSYNNYCTLDLSTIKRYLRALQILVPFKWKIIEEDRSFRDYNLLRVDISTDIKGFQHKFLLTYIRYMYEFPYNVILSDAYRLKNLPEYKFESITNLYQLCALLYPGCYGTGHALAFKAKHCSNKNLINRLNSRRTNLNNLLESYYIRKDLGDIPYRRLEYWTNKENFEIRLEKYNEVYKKWIKESM